MSSSSDRFLLSDSGSERSRNSGSSRDDSSDREEVGSVGRIPVERVVEIREDPSEELAESNWPTKTRYEWGARRDIIAPERVTAVECACHGREGAAEEFFYMYMCHFSQLHIRLPFDEFTMGVLRLLNVAPTQLHPNSWAYLPKSPITWLLLISQPGLNKLEAFTQSFKHFKDGFFKVVVKPVGRSHFYTTDGNTKFSFFWTGNPWRYKVISREDLSVGEKEVVDTLMQFSDKIPTKGLVRVYNSVHPIMDIEGHMAQLGKKNLTLFQALRKEKAKHGFFLETIIRAPFSCHSLTFRSSFGHLPLVVHSPSARRLLVVRAPSAIFVCRPRAICTIRAPSARPPCTVRELSARPPRTICRTVPSIVHLLTLPFIPDSPKWLDRVGWWKECESAL
ncbi:hypothetical protein DEO72_LG4g892 [Vigna unguiculata]|uniref:Transposase n=1 Tax=Vigna unguiculata TaxID=3917 RepID=A0A4D6LN29_VIGUN|nr:hypothetical protein DEO72_LG4g892 [Vigna unguiculata]